ncbi:hypothetical protein [Aeoliella sp.]|uniref:hypothetical protein n=1 Tax=Aeoliella sp. TaxID=2795800 RepID=UPI003CCBD8BB
MGHQSLKLAVAVAAMLTLGCKPSVDLPERTDTPEASTDSTAQTGGGEVSDDSTTTAKRESANTSKPALSDGTNYGGAIAGARRHAMDFVVPLVFKDALDKHYASEGKYPKSHEEFMKRVWEPLKAPMPRIDDGYKWQYDPADHTVKPVPIEGTE